MIKWQHKVSNKDLYNKRKYIKWADKIKTRRLRWVGHLVITRKNSSPNRSTRSTITSQKTSWQAETKYG